MTRDYATPPAFKQALEARLRGESQRRGTALQRVRQLVVFDRMLARMIAVLGDAMILKGGVALELRLERARSTKDIDVRAVGDPEAFLERLQEAGRLDLGDFMTFEVTPDRRHAELEVEGLKYGGRRYRAEARLAGKVYGAAFGIDVAFAEPVAGEIETLVGSDLLGFAGVPPTRVRTYPVDAHVAEKLHALTLPRSRPNSRVKDLPDLGLLGSIRPIAGTDLRAAIERTFTSRGTHDVPNRVPEPRTRGHPCTSGWRRRTTYRGSTFSASSRRFGDSSIPFSKEIPGSGIRRIGLGVRRRRGHSTQLSYERRASS